MIITKTPLRISLLGGNTDFPKYFKKYGGAGITASIDKYIYCIVKERFDKEIRVNYSIKEIVHTIKDIKHDLVREAMKLVGVKEGIEITFLSDIPSEGSGLGSSSALVVGLLNALHHYKNDPVTTRQLAEEACKIEVDILKNPIGYQDQYAVAFGGCNLIEYGKEITLRPFELNEECLLLFYTGITRKTTDVLSKLKLDKKILDKNKSLVYRAGKEMLSVLLNESWELKKKLNPLTTNKEIDTMYQTALNLGALGGKIIGAGGGGFLLLNIRVKDQYEFRQNFSLKELPFRLYKYGSRVIFNSL